MSETEPQVDVVSNLSNRVKSSINGEKTQKNGVASKIKTWYNKLVSEEGKDEVTKREIMIVVNVSIFVAGSFLLNPIANYINNLK